MSRNNGNDGYEDLSGEIDASVPVELGDTESILEEVIHVNKAQSVLFFGALSWLLLFIFGSEAETHQRVMEGLQENIGEIASLWLFLLSSIYRTKCLTYHFF